MSPIEWLATLLWDRTGRKRREQRLRLARSHRKLHEYDAVHKNAMRQIRRTQAAAQKVRQ